jgi:pilus assembly protein CpaB
MAAKPRGVFIVGALAVVLAAVAAYFLYDYLRGQEERVRTAVATDKAVVAAQPISIGSTIGATQVKAVDWPRANMPQGAFTSTDHVVGRVAIQSLPAGDIVTEAKLVPKEGAPGILTWKIPEGHRAMTVGVDQVAGVAGFLTPGNMVDVILTANPPGSVITISRIVLQNVPVLAIGQIIEQKEGKPVVVPTVTMDVVPEDAEKLAIASTQGRLQLVLRRAGDIQNAVTAGSNVMKVIGAPPKPLVVTKRVVKREIQVVQPPKPAGVAVEVIQGGKKSTETFRGE